MSEELQRAYEHYEKLFNSTFPTIPLAETREDNEIIDIINECIEENKDVYDLGYLSHDVIY